MTNRTPYSYTVLRYVHDVMTGEFVNVGVVLYAPTLGQMRWKVRNTIGRIREFFPDLDGQAFRAAMRSAGRCIGHVNKNSETSGIFREVGDALSLARRAIPVDDNSLQWSPLSAGVTDNIDKTLDRLYNRLVAKYDGKSRHRRTDDEVWRPVRDLLNERNIPVELQEKVVVGASDRIAFQHAWKNGCWHAYAPISLDLADAEGIKDKVRRWRGHLAAVADGAIDDVKLYFVVGAPRNPVLHNAYESAINILRKSAFSPEVYEENQIDALVNRIEEEVRSHGNDR